MREVVPRPIHVQDPREDARGREVLQVRALSVRGAVAAPPREPHPNSHRRETVPVRRVRAVFPPETAAEEAQELVSHARLHTARTEGQTTQVRWLALLFI